MVEDLQMLEAFRLFVAISWGGVVAALCMYITGWGYGRSVGLIREFLKKGSKP